MKEMHASATARLIAVATIMQPDLAPRDASRWACRLLGGDNSWIVRAARSSIGKKLGTALEKLTLPGITNHWLSRKCEIDRLARHAYEEGFEQLLVIGAGFDTLSFRMAEEKLFIRVISADHPATLNALPSMPSGVEFFPIDASGDDALPEVSPLPTLIVLEGLLMYLRDAAVKRLLGGLGRLPLPRARLVASWMLDAPGHSIGFREQSWLISAWLRLRGEPMLWASTPARLIDLLKDAGWSDAQFIRFALKSKQLAVADAGSFIRPQFR